MKNKILGLLLLSMTYFNLYTAAVIRFTDMDEDLLNLYIDALYNKKITIKDEKIDENIKTSRNARFRRELIKKELQKYLYGQEYQHIIGQYLSDPESEYRESVKFRESLSDRRVEILRSLNKTFGNTGINLIIASYLPNILDEQEEAPETLAIEERRNVIITKLKNSFPKGVDQIIASYLPNAKDEYRMCTNTETIISNQATENLELPSIDKNLKEKDEHNDVLIKIDVDDNDELQESSSKKDKVSCIV